MLIIAQPKSASTSLLDALGELTGLPSLQQKSVPGEDVFRIAYGTAPEFTILPHSDMGAAMPASILGGWMTDRARFFKQHVVPTEYNLKLLRECDAPALILLRPIEESCASYLRIPPGEPGHSFALALQDDSLSREELVEELRIFQDRYRALAADLPGRFRIITFAELVSAPVTQLRAILAFYGIDAAVPGDYLLPKRRYYRDRPA